jgi:alpha-amylase
MLARMRRAVGIGRVYAGIVAVAVAVAVASPRQAIGQTGPTSAITGWKRGAVCYEVFVRSFYDSDGDGIGDLNGLTQKLDYINDGNPASTTDLGARCIWLMPVVASPSYHGYDATNYYRVNPQYGTNADFKRFMAAAHRHGIKVLVDMVLNHVSSEHPMFESALLDPGSPYRSWFRWSPTKPDQKGPWGQEVWHKSPVRDEYYYGVFWEGMPDLNYDTPAVREEAKKIARFWLDSMGVDGFRLDAVPYLVEEGNQLAGTAGTHAFLREYQSYVRRIAPRAFTVGEVWDSVGAVAAYYPDQLDSYFTFELSDALIDGVRSGSANKLLDGYLRMQRMEPADRWSPFLRNHDQMRTMTALGGDVARAKLAATLLLTLPGLPFVYYGEEIGMTGDKPDPRIRTPMQWRPGPAAGFTTGLPWEPLQPDSMTANVEVERRDPTSLRQLYRRLIHLRASNAALGTGELVRLETGDSAVTAYLRVDGRHAVLVIANLGASSAVNVRLSSPAGVLAAGRYTLTPLIGRAAGQPLVVESDGRVSGYAPVASLAPVESYVFELAQ